MADMDIDMDLDLGLDPEIAAQEAEAERLQNAPAANPTISADDSMDAESVPEKVHIRGLDNFSTNDVKRFANDLFPTDQFVKIEWINDTSANIVYAESEIARDALLAFTAAHDVAPATIPPLQLRAAKPLSTHPDVPLQVRQAVATDVKARGARDASRYYLMNPDKDPRERKRERTRDTSENGDYRRNRFDDREHRRRQKGDRNAFDASMYDDDEDAATASGSRRSRSTSLASDDDRQRKRVRFDRNRVGDDLFASRFTGRSDGGSSAGGRLRNRSASPTRDGDGRMGFAEDNNNTSIRSRIRRRSLTPPAATRRPQKDLFASLHDRPSVLAGRASTPTAQSSRELFPDRERAVTSSKKAKELFPTKQVHSNHRRSDAFDINGDTSESGQVRDLFDRIHSPTGTAEGRLKDADGPVQVTEFDAGDRGLSIKGAAKQDGVHGFYIKGAAGGAAGGGAGAGAARELFPMKAGAQQDLFAEKLKGRGGPRKRAEDLFS